MKLSQKYTFRLAEEMPFIRGDIKKLLAEGDILNAIRMLKEYQSLHERVVDGPVYSEDPHWISSRGSEEKYRRRLSSITKKFGEEE